MRTQVIQNKINALRNADCWVTAEEIAEILAFGREAVPYFEDLLHEVVLKSKSVSSQSKPDTQWFLAVHCLYFLAHLRADDALDLILDFLGQKQAVLEYWFPDVLADDLWEVLFLLGGEHPDRLQQFLLDTRNNPFSRLAAVTAVVQLRLHGRMDRNAVQEIFKALLHARHEESDFIGLVVSELLDLREPALLPDMLAALRRHRVPPEILSPEEVEHCVNIERPRKRTPLDLQARYAYFKKLAYFSRTTPGVATKHANLRQLQKLLK